MQATIHGVAKSQARLNDFTSLHFGFGACSVCPFFPYLGGTGLSTYSQDTASPHPHPDAASSNLKPDSEGQVECIEEDVFLAGLCSASWFRQGKAPRHHLFPPPEQKHRSPRCTLPLRRGGLASFATKPVRFPLGQGNTTGNESKKGRL